MHHKSGNVCFSRSGDTFQTDIFILKQWIAYIILLYFHGTWSCFYEVVIFLPLCAYIFVQSWENRKNHDRRHAVSSLLAELNLPSTAYWFKLAFENILTFVQIFLGIT